MVTPDPRNARDMYDYQAAVSGEEAVGGTAPTPDQDDTENLAVAAGIEVRDRHPLHTRDLLEQRDDRRWELDPDSDSDARDLEEGDR